MSNLLEQMEALTAARLLTDAQRAALDERIERYEENPSNVIAWEQVRAGLFAVEK
jgi:putative addiction module component (TIGR02574 family)